MVSVSAGRGSAQRAGAELESRGTSQMRGRAVLIGKLRWVRASPASQRGHFWGVTANF